MLKTFPRYPHRDWMFDVVSQNNAPNCGSKVDIQAHRLQNDTVIEQEWIKEKGHAYIENCLSLNEKGTEQQGLMNIFLELHHGVQSFTKMLRCLWLQANKKSLGFFCSF
jgi:hypothetical protein